MNKFIRMLEKYQRELIQNDFYSKKNNVNLKKQMKNFEEQIINLELVVVNTPRTYIQWENTEFGRDKKDSYERIDIGGTIIYVNVLNRNSSITKDHPFWNTLEKFYSDLLDKPVSTVKFFSSPL